MKLANAGEPIISDALNVNQVPLVDSVTVAAEISDRRPMNIWSFLITQENKMPTLWEGAKEKLGVILLTMVASVATIFSDQIVGGIKAELNMADQRPAQQEKIAKDISAFIFAVENMIEFASKNMTAKNELHFVVEPYNAAVEALRKNEYVYFSAVHRYWDEPIIRQYEVFFADVRSVDAALHQFNDEYAAVESGAQKKADEAKIRPLVQPAISVAKKLQHSAKELLTALSK
jgi:chemotaxis protein CheY-P-specific phosphatase CheC